MQLSVCSGVQWLSRFVLCLAAFMVPSPSVAQTQPLITISMRELEEELKVGDIIFIHVDILPFRKIAHDTMSWTNHVGIVIDISGKEPVIAESTFPFSKAGPLSKFIKRSKAGKVAVRRLNRELTAMEQENIKVAAFRRIGIFYDSGFNLYSRRQFCSRYVHEVIQEATGVHVGTIENFNTLFKANPDADLWFWRIWYFGRIPWQRETVTPASMLNSPDVHVIFDGYAKLKS